MTMLKLPRSIHAICKSIVLHIITFQAKKVLNRYKPYIIAVTGSVGKTTTKDLIYEVVKTSAHSRKNEKSYNSEIGVPITILGRPTGWLSVYAWITNIKEGFMLLFTKQEYPQNLILEIGVDKKGDMQKHMAYIRPDITVLTQFAKEPVHREGFESREELYEEKLLLAQHIKAGGTIIYNADDTLVARYLPLFPPTVQTISYGRSDSADVRIADSTILYTDGRPIGMQYILLCGDEKNTIVLHGIIGDHMAYPISAALATGLALDQQCTYSAGTTQLYAPEKGRMHILEGINDSVIIDDTYNSSPLALKCALNTLHAVRAEGTGKKIALLGSMYELGVVSRSQHERYFKQACDVAQLVIVVGKEFAEFAESCDHALVAENVHDAGIIATQHIQTNDIILAKASQGVRMEKALKSILSTNHSAAEVLVRQGKEWK